MLKKSGEQAVKWARDTLRAMGEEDVALMKVTAKKRLSQMILLQYNRTS